MLLANVPAERKQKMASKKDTELRREIAYLTSKKLSPKFAFSFRFFPVRTKTPELIENHKKSTVASSRNKPRLSAGGNRFKWTSAQPATAAKYACTVHSQQLSCL